jgi:arylsulfatase A-like enzyme
MGHGYHIYDFLIRVPLIFAGNGIFPAGRRIPDMVRQVDILPTIIECMQLSTKKADRMHGRSLLPLIKGEQMQEEPAYITACGREIKEKDYLVGLRKSNIKFVYAPMNSQIPPELYDLKDDPSESKNLVYSMPDIAEQMKQELLTIQATAMSMQEPHGSEMLQEEKEKLKKTLQDLGYL